MELLSSIFICATLAIFLVTLPVFVCVCPTVSCLMSFQSPTPVGPSRGPGVLVLQTSPLHHPRILNPEPLNPLIRVPWAPTYSQAPPPDSLAGLRVEGFVGFRLREGSVFCNAWRLLEPKKNQLYLLSESHLSLPGNAKAQDPGTKPETRSGSPAALNSGVHRRLVRAGPRLDHSMLEGWQLLETPQLTVLDSHGAACRTEQWL